MRGLNVNKSFRLKEFEVFIEVLEQYEKIFVDDAKQKVFNRFEL